MKHIKYYDHYTELSNKNKFWVVDTTMPNFEISLDKIGVPEDKKISMMKSYDQIKKNKKVYIGIEYYSTAANGLWTWDEDAYGFAQYMGSIIITKDDFEKWEFDNTQIKYNL